MNRTLRLGTTFLVFAAVALLCRDSAAEICNTSVSANKIACFEPYTWPVPTFSLNVVSGRSYVIRVVNLAVFPFYTNTPDTVMWLLNKNSNTIMAINDDVYSGNLASQISFVATNSYSGEVVLAGYSSTSQGVCDVEVWENGALVSTQGGLVFGGYSERYIPMVTGDEMYVGIPPNVGVVSYYSNKLLVFTNSVSTCSYGATCGSYVEGESVGGLSRVTIPFSATGRVVVGSSLGISTVPTRWLYSRLATHDDLDGDGLTSELESLDFSSDQTKLPLTINTCDSATGPSNDCSGGRMFSSRGGDRTVWSPADTDNDGLSDLWEVFGVRKGCERVPVEPMNNVGQCFDRTRGAQGADAFTVSFPLSQQMTDPRELDAFFYILPDSSDSGGDTYLSADSWDVVRYPYEVEGLQCPSSKSTDPADCPGEIEGSKYYHANLHIIRGSTVDRPLRHHVHSKYAYISDHFNKAFPDYLKYTSIADMVYLTQPWCRGFSHYSDRLSISAGNVPGRNQDDLGWRLAHEMGHSMDIAGETKDFSVGLMSYKYWSSLAQKPNSGDTLWPADFGSSCGSDADCLASSECVGGQCDVRCSTSEPRISREAGLVFDETDLVEVPIDRNRAANYRCHQSGVNAICDVSPLASDQCGVDFDADGVFEASSVNCSFSGDATCQTSEITYNGWSDVYDATRLSIQSAPSYKEEFRVLELTFDESTPFVDSSAWETSIANTGVGTASTFANYGTQAVFDGPWENFFSPDVLTVPQNAITNTLDQTPTGEEFRGYRVDLMAQIDTFSDANSLGHELIKSNIFGIYVDNNTRRVYGWINDGTNIKTLESSIQLDIGTPYWIALRWQMDGTQNLIVVPWDSGVWNYSAASCDRRLSPRLSGVSTGTIYIGHDSADWQWQTHGWIDQVRVYRGTPDLAMNQDPCASVSCD